MIPPLRYGMACAQAVILSAILVVAPDEASGQPVASSSAAVCEQAYEEAQVRRQKRTLLAARESLMRCAQADCPKVAQTDCSAWLVEVERSIPSVVILPRRAGVDLVDVVTVIDGTPSLVKPGDAVLLEPGPHRVVVQVGGQEQAATFTLPEGEKLRQVVLEFNRPEAPQEASSGGQPAFLVTAVATGAGAIVGFGLFAALGGIGLSEENELEACKPGCSSTSVRDVGDLYVAADAALVTGAVLAAMSATFFLVWAVTPEASPSGQTMALRPAVSFGRDRAFIGIEGVLP